MTDCCVQLLRPSNRHGCATRQSAGATGSNGGKERERSEATARNADPGHDVTAAAGPHQACG
eukprot:13911924-Alexandrium_andersonii.AAC.1